jgi:peptidyl-prolyl cis-trans isomerase C
MWALGALAGLVLSGPVVAQAPAPAAVVNGKTITVAEVDAIIKSRGPLPVEIPAAKQRHLQLEILSMLIDTVLMEQFLAQHGPRITDAEMAKYLAEVEQAVKKAGKSMQEYYKDTGQTAEQLRANIRHTLQWEGYAKTRLNDADVKRYYDENKDFFDGVTVRASHILMRLPATATDAERQAARQQLLALRQEIISGKISFADAAKKHSQCPTAPQGGDIGSFPRKMVVEESFAKTAFAMKPGEISDVVTTDFGLHLIHVTERKPGAQPSEYEKIKDVVRDFCIEEMRQAVLAQERQKAKIEVLLGKP